MSVSIRSRLLVLAAALLLPATAALLWVVWQSLQTEQHAMQGRLRDSARALALVTDLQLAQRVTVARMLALSRTLDGPGEPSATELAYFEGQARRAMEGLGGWVELRSARGELLNTRPGASAPAHLATPMRTPLPLQDRGSVGSLERDPVDGGQRAIVTEPVVREGQVKLNVRVVLLPQQLQAIVDQQDLPQGWIATVLDDRGTVVARHPGGAAMVGRSSTADMHERLARSRDALFESTSLDGHPVVGYFSTSPLGWRYLMAVPRETLYAGTREAVLPLVVGAVLLLALGLGGAIVVARRIARPVQALEQAATELQAGRNVMPVHTGISECDAVFAALGEASETLARSHAEMQLRVDEAVERTRETEQRASQGQRDEALGRLTGGIAHDFNNLLGVISNSAHLVERQAGNAAAQQGPLQAILRSVHVGSRLTQHMLRFAGRQAVRPQALRLSSALPECQELLRSVLGRRISLEIIVEPGTQRLWADASELELALINIASNARRAMPTGGQAWLRARNATPDEVGDLPAREGGYLMVSFADSGSGVSEEVARRMFEPFFSTEPLGTGSSGLGLSQVMGFCRQAGGTARVASTEGLGTTIMLLLPAMQAQDEGTAVPADTQPGQELLGKQVLVVDDNEELGRVTAALLTSFGCKVTRAASAGAALSLYELGGPFDVVLSDIVMPGEMDGIALARALRERHPELPIVLVTGYNTTQESPTEFPLLQKPCTPQLLLETLQRAINAVAAGTV